MVYIKKATAASVEVQWLSKSSLIFLLQDFTSKDLLLFIIFYLK